MDQIWRGHDSEPPKSCVPRYPWGLSAAPALAPLCQQECLTLKWTPLWSWNTHVISMRATEDITITLHSHYSAGHEKPVSLAILFCSQPESGWRLCEPLPPRLYLTLPDDCQPQTSVSTTLATASSSAARQTRASTSSTRRIPYPTRHHQTAPPSLNSHIASINIQRRQQWRWNQQ